MNTPLDSNAFKAATRELWDKHATGWNAHSAEIQAWLRDPTEAMLTMAEVGPGARVLDVAAGAGDQTLDIAQRVGLCVDRPTHDDSCLDGTYNCCARKR